MLSVRGALTLATAAAWVAGTASALEVGPTLEMSRRNADSIAELDLMLELTGQSAGGPGDRLHHARRQAANG